jgi:Cu(I)/Ag(I) efflux system membrane fusion protein
MKNYLFLLISFLLITGCKSKIKPIANTDIYYTCSMHPQIMENKPGHCPICHMDLISVHRSNTNNDEISLNDEQIRLGNIQTDSIHNGMLGDNLVLTATLTADESKMNSINARIMGRIEKLYHKNLGDYISKGDLLYDLYSEELNNAKQEYLVAFDKMQTLDNSIIDFKQLVQSARTKLLLWGMTENQINDLSVSKKSNSFTSFYSNVSGYITEMSVLEGQFVAEGATILKLADLSGLWAQAQVYSTQMSGITDQQTAQVLVPDFPGMQWTGKIEFANPEIVTDSRLDLLRIPIANKNGLLKPGMPAYVRLKDKQRKVLSLPTDAVLRDGKSNTIWVRSGKNNFKMKQVQIGTEAGDRIEIRAGLQEGDQVVIHGAYLLQSEYIFKNGPNAMNGMKM